jgi:hypothetical protein
MTTRTIDDLEAALQRIHTLETDLRALRSAPPSLEEQVAAAWRDLDQAEAAFRRDPWQLPAGDPRGIGFILRGMAAALWPKETREFEVARITSRVAADPRTSFDTASRATRIAAVEAQVEQLVTEIGQDDLQTLRSAANSAHATYRGLRQRCEEMQHQVDLRTAAIARARAQRERLERPAPLVGYWNPDLPPPRPLSAEDRTAAREDTDRQLVDQEAQLERDRMALAALEAEAATAAEQWRRYARLAEDCEKLLQRRALAPAA